MRSIQLFVPSAIILVMLTHVRDATSTKNHCSCKDTAIVCSDSNITSFGPAEHCDKKVTHILLIGNQISSLPENAFSGLSHLKMLIIHKNKLIKLPEGIFNESRSIEYLSIKNNPIRNLPSGLFYGLQKLKKLYLTQNNIDTLSPKLFSGLRSLEVLDLSRNSLTSLPQQVFSDLKNLKHLDLSNNRFTSLPTGIFSHLMSLQALSLSFNALTSIKGSDLIGMVSLENLSLANNRLSVLPPYDDKWPATSGVYYFFSNNITSVNEDVLRSWLLSGDKQRILLLSARTTMPLEDVSSLRSLLRDSSVEPFVRGPCRCGGLKKGKAEIRFCVNILCGESNQPKNWVTAIRK